MKHENKNHKHLPLLRSSCAARSEGMSELQGVYVGGSIVENQNYWMKELAYSFGMTISQFAKTTGYSRATLYQASCGSTKLNKERIGLVAFKLNELSRRIMESDIKYAEARHEDRQKLVKEFERKFSREEQ